MSNPFESESYHRPAAIMFDQFVADGNGEEFSKLKERVKESNGLVRIFIHPFHMMEDEEINKRTFNFAGKELPLGGKPFLILNNTITKESSPPVFVFQPRNKMDIFEALAQAYWADLPNPLYVVPTGDFDPYPIIAGMPEVVIDSDGIVRGESLESRIDSTRIFIETLSEAGVDAILIGGAELVVKEKSINHCVGAFINFLEDFSDMEIKVSAGTIPHGRRELQESGRDDLL